MDEEQFRELGKFVAEHYTGVLTVDNRPMTNMEMFADLRAWREEKAKRIAKYGCCGEGHDVMGFCFGYGKCPQFENKQQTEGGVV